ncbi:hypothetical protein H072_2094 [Dactylellina haptotyla CBS 200.50]|uniref:Uncharacterized protein n=1 Tax=Dactylellina haptotyla (strain CBS 200.50) TaxID=1284197 RepID=S8BWE8_DACHA|nr:hypothetical protein H072_2094 [Dactylellina haptotyla CBS 200.50]
MSIYLRLAAPCRRRPITLVRRVYSSKATLQPKDEDALKIWEDIEALELTDATQLFDQEIFSRDDDDDGEGLDLPVSPIMDRKAWKRRFKSEKKLPKPHPSEMTADELNLMKNPYANALATVVRQESYFRRRLPTAFLQKMHPFVHPETREPWILPTGNKTTDKSLVLTGISKYIGNSHTGVEFLNSKRWKRLLETKFVVSAVWRMDMTEFVLKQLRKRVYEEVAKSQRWIMSANRDGGKWEDLSIGCLLVWENGDPNFAKAAGESSETGDSVEDISENSASDQEPTSEDGKQRPTATRAAGSQFGAVRTLVEVKGKIIPSYNMHLLLGTEQAAALKKQLKIEPVVRKNVLLISPRTMKPQTWLWKLAGYMREQPGVSLFENVDNPAPGPPLMADTNSNANEASSVLSG